MSGVNGAIITEAERGLREIVSTLNLTLTAPSMSGEYRCVADNDVIGRGEINEASVNLTVLGEGMVRFNKYVSPCFHIIIIVSPMVTSVYPDTSQMSYTVNVGEAVTFECVATGIPPPSITWYRNGTELDNNNTRVTFNYTSGAVTVMDGEGEMIFEITRTLILNTTEDGDSGIYECRASNEAIPGDNSMEFELIVQSK